MSQKQTINLRIADFGLSKHLEDHYSEIGNYEWVKDKIIINDFIIIWF